MSRKTIFVSESTLNRLKHVKNQLNADHNDDTINQLVDTYEIFFSFYERFGDSVAPEHLKKFFLEALISSKKVEKNLVLLPKGSEVQVNG